MAGVTREIRFNIKADVDQAIRSITDLGREIDSQSGKVKTDFDAQRFNDNVRQSVGVLGDVDTAMQTLGSTLQIEGLQIVGDFFAIGEAAAQLAGTVPLLISGFTGLLPVLTPLLPILAPLALAAGAVGVAVHALTQEYRDQQAEIERLQNVIDQANKDIDSFKASLSSMSAGELRDTVDALSDQRDALARMIDVQKSLWQSTDDLEIKFYAVTQSLDSAVEAMDVATFEEWADNVRDFSNLTEEEAERQKSILEDRLATEQRIFDEAVRLYGENSEQAQEVAIGIDELTTALEYLNETDFSKTAANIASLREEGFGKLNDLASGLGGLFGDIADNVTGQLETYWDAAGDMADDAIKEQEKVQQEWLKEQERLAQEQQRLLEQQERERQRMLEQQARDYERQLGQVEDFERRQADIRNRWREQALQAELNNDVEAFLNARRERKEARRDLASQVNSTFNINVGELVTPQELQNLESTIVNALTFVNSQKAGTF